MGAKLDGMMAAAPDDYTLTDDYKAFVESIAETLRNSPSTRQIVVTPEAGYLYRFDLTGLLLLQKVPLEDHLLIRRVNRMTSIHDIDEELSVIYVPDASQVARLKQIYRTRLAAK